LAMASSTHLVSSPYSSWVHLRHLSTRVSKYHLANRCPRVLLLPLTTTIPFAASTCITFKLCIVFLCPPIFPAIFLPGYTLLPPPCPCPAEPMLLWASDTPCDLSCPCMPHLFMTPWNPLPLQLLLVSTNWPSINQSACISSPTASNPL